MEEVQIDPFKGKIPLRFTSMDPMTSTSLPSNPTIIQQFFANLKRLLQAFFSYDDEKTFPLLPWAWIGLLFIAGIILWGVFFNWGNVNINYMDWAEVWPARLQAWRDALIHNTLPFHFNDVAAVRNGTDRYFATADMVSTPQLLLLRWLEVGPYTLVNTLLLYAFATGYLIKIRNKYRLSLFAFSMAFLLFHFNGHIVTHLSIGHLNWGGHYFLPAFTFYLLELVETKVGWQWVAKMAFVLTFILMQGAFHHLLWCFIVLGISAVLCYRQAFTIFKTLLATILLTLPRLLPVFFLEIKAPRGIDFIGGYPTLWDLIRSLIYNSTPNMGMPRQIFDTPLGYWEFDSFVGWPGLIFLALFGVAWLLISHYKQKKFPVLFVPTLVLIFLSISDNYLKVLFHNPILASTERATSRMMGLALVMLIILAVIYYQQFANRYHPPLVFQLAQLGLLAWTAYVLVLHTLRWSVKNAFGAFPFVARDLTTLHVSNHPDPVYYTQMGVGLGISLLTTALLIWAARKREVIT